MGNYEQVKLKESQFIARFQENLSGVAGGILESDSLAELRKLTGGKLLRNELEARYPLGKSLSVRITPKAGLFGKERLQIVLVGKVIVRLEKVVEKGGDDEPISPGELNSILSKESDLANRNRCECVLGLFSPTGWAEDAKKFIENEPPGSGWASNQVYPVLVGPEITELVWDKKTDKLSKYVQYFCGLTLDERSKVCRDAIKRAILVQEFANLGKIAQEKGANPDFVQSIAKQMASEEKELVLRKVTGVGLVLKKKI